MATLPERNLESLVRRLSGDSGLSMTSGLGRISLTELREALTAMELVGGQGEPTGFTPAFSRQRALDTAALAGLSMDPLNAALFARAASHARVALEISRLDSEDFETRQSAQRNLRALGLEAIPQLEHLLTGNPALEHRRRAELLIRQIDSDEMQRINPILPAAEAYLPVSARVLDDVLRRLYETRIAALDAANISINPAHLDRLLGLALRESNRGGTEEQRLAASLRYFALRNLRAMALDIHRDYARHLLGTGRPQDRQLALHHLTRNFNINGYNDYSAYAIAVSVGALDNAQWMANFRARGGNVEYLQQVARNLNLRLSP